MRLLGYEERIGREEGDEGTGMEMKPGRVWDELWGVEIFRTVGIGFFFFFLNFIFIFWSDLMEKEL